MKFVRFEYGGITSYGLVQEETVWALAGSPFDSYQITDTHYALPEVTLLSPCLPTKGVCIGLNYRDHAQEMGVPIPSSPIVFIKPSGCTIGPLSPILYPPLSKRIDYEAELAIVIGKKSVAVSEKEAPQFILGYTCANDVTARDFQGKSGPWAVAKGFDTFMPLGPVITDEIDPANVHITSRLNGEVRQFSNTKNLIFTSHFLVSYLSHIMTLYPGDVILTGTPAGIGPMHIGDTIEVEIEGIGILTNKIASRLQ